MEIGGLSDFNYCWHAAGGRDVGGSTGGGRRGGPGAEPPDCHETNFKCLTNKFGHEIRHDL